MTCTRHGRPTAQNPQLVAHRRRERAIWHDYLETTRDVSGQRYVEVERNAWERLQRRLARNDERMTREKAVTTGR